MEDGVRNCKCFLAIVTDNGQDSYFSREMCRQEIQWALDAGKTIVPVCDRDDKQKIGAFIGDGQKHGIDFGSCVPRHTAQFRPSFSSLFFPCTIVHRASRYNFADFDRSGPRKAKLSIEEIIEQAGM